MKTGNHRLPPHVASILSAVTCGVLGTEHDVVSRQFSIDCTMIPIITIKLDVDSRHRDALTGSSASIVLRPDAWVHADRYAFVEGCVENKNEYLIITLQKVIIRENGANQAEYTIPHKAE